MLTLLVVELVSHLIDQAPDQLDNNKRIHTALLAMDRGSVHEVHHSYLTPSLLKRTSRKRSTGIRRSHPLQLVSKNRYLCAKLIDIIFLHHDCSKAAAFFRLELYRLWYGNCGKSLVFSRNEPPYAMVLLFSRCRQVETRFATANLAHRATNGLLLL